MLDYNLIHRTKLLHYSIIHFARGHDDVKMLTDDWTTNSNDISSHYDVEAARFSIKIA